MIEGSDNMEEQGAQVKCQTDAEAKEWCQTSDMQFWFYDILKRLITQRDKYDFEHDFELTICQKVTFSLFQFNLANVKLVLREK